MSGANNPDDKKVKHLEFIQSVVTRMNSNSFLIKGWVITIVTAVLALMASTHNRSFIVITALPIIVFWLLDSFYLQTERKFISLYNKTIASNSTIALFVLDIDIDIIKNEKRNRYYACAFSRTILCFYLALLIIAGSCIFFINSDDDNKKPLKVYISTADTLRLETVNPLRHLPPRIDTIK